MAGCELSHPTNQHRFRITLDIDTPEGLRSGSSIWSVSCTEPMKFLGVMGGAGCRVRGEAIFVPLPNGRAVIGLMVYGAKGKGVDIDDTAARAFDFKGGGAGGGWYSQAPHWTGSRPLKGERIPTLVTFTDLGDPKTVRELRPEGVDFVAAFGNGYRFNGATLEMVDPGFWPFNLFGLTGEPTAKLIEARLPEMFSTLREMDKRPQVVYPNEFRITGTGYLRQE